jgi:hypothetical protein
VSDIIIMIQFLDGSLLCYKDKYIVRCSLVLLCALCGVTNHMIILNE